MQSFHNDVKPWLDPSRTLWLLVGFAFALFSLFPTLLNASAAPKWWALGASGVILIIALGQPTWLAPVSWPLRKVGRVFSGPILLGLLFYGILSPVGWLMRLARVDLLNLRHNPDAQTYWTATASRGRNHSKIANEL